MQIIRMLMTDPRPSPRRDLSQVPTLGVLESHIAVLCVDLKASDATMGDLAWPVLSDDEVDRAGRFRFPHLTAKYVLARAVLRCLLGALVEQRPESLQFEIGPHGKPSLNIAGTRLAFNVSHSGDLAAYAVALECEIGIDVEQVRPVPELLTIAGHYFTEEERAEISASGPASEAAFFRCWTRKEAYIKAVGGGLSIPLNSFRVPVGPVGGVHRWYPEQGGQCWSLAPFEPTAGYVAAVVFNSIRHTCMTGPVLHADALLPALCAWS